MKRTLDQLFAARMTHLDLAAKAFQAAAKAERDGYNGDADDARAIAEYHIDVARVLEA